jgi:outer membrane protein
MNISRWLSAAFLSAVVLGAGRLEAQGQAQKFAYIDSRIVVDRAPGTAAAQAALTKEGEAMQAQVQLWQDSLRVMVEAYEKVSKTLTDAQRAAREKTLTDKRTEYARRADELDGQMQERQAELSRPIMAQIRETLDAIRLEDGYTLIFDIAANGVIVAADKNLDLTEKVIGRLKPIPLATKGDSTGVLGAKPKPAGVKKPGGA